MKKVLLGSVILSVILFLSFFVFATKSSNTKKINGISLVSPPKKIEEATFLQINEIKSNWVALIPYAFVPYPETKIHFDQERQWWGEKTEGVEALISLAKKANQKTMLKPHLWVRRQGWPGELTYSNTKEWKEWEKEYEAYILHFATVAQRNKVDLFCLGTEIRNSVKERPEFWNALIEKVKAVYTGKITYAANWDNYQHVRFWKQLDYIGIDSYFPLSNKKQASYEELKHTQDSINIVLKRFSEKKKKQILFTEFGFESIDYATMGHWKFDKDTVSANPSYQQTAYNVVFENVWNQPWFAGGFLWKWHFSSNRAGGMDCKRYTPQKKPALKSIQYHYGMH